MDSFGIMVVNELPLIPPLADLGYACHYGGVTPALTPADILAHRQAESRRLPDLVLLEGQGVIANLLRLGWSLEASGDDALVFGHTENPVVLRLAQNWQAYEKFVYLSRRLENPHLPRFHRWETMGKISLAVVERLLPISRTDHAWKKINHAAALGHTCADGRPLGGEISETALDVAALALGRQAEQHYYALDLGIGNILVRPGSGEPVFNDPWSEWGE